MVKNLCCNKNTSGKASSTGFVPTITGRGAIHACFPPFPTTIFLFIDDKSCSALDPISILLGIIPSAHIREIYSAAPTVIL
jgi:hypothetical protein